MNYYNEIKQELINNEIVKKVKDYSKNKSDLNTYYNVGKLLSQAGKHYGEGIIRDYSKKLTIELNKKYGIRNLYNMRSYYELSLKLQTMSAKFNINVNLSWSHYVELLSIGDINEIIYYIKIADEQNLSVRQLKEKIRCKEYDRLDDNTKNKLINNDEFRASDFIKNPILIKNNFNYTEISEKMLKKLILEDIDNFLTELGEGFSYIKSEYKIKLGDRYNYIDLLLYNFIYNCYIVVELKVVQLKSDHIGQIQKYMNYIDKNIKNNFQDKTIGIIICKKDNKFVMEYCSDDRIFRTIYVLN